MLVSCVARTYRQTYDLESFDALQEHIFAIDEFLLLYIVVDTMMTSNSVKHCAVIIAIDVPHPFSAVTNKTATSNCVEHCTEIIVIALPHEFASCFASSVNMSRHCLYKHRHLRENTNTRLAVVPVCSPRRSNACVMRMQTQLARLSRDSL